MVTPEGTIIEQPKTAAVRALTRSVTGEAVAAPGMTHEKKQ